MKSELNSLRIDSPIGKLVAVADERALQFLAFEQTLNFKKDWMRLQKKTGAEILPGRSGVLNSIEEELALYFDKKLHCFKTPIKTWGTAFQIAVWNELQKIPVGETRSYFDVATALNQSTAVRAVARANATNFLVIVIPCHRVINKNGQMGGYGGGLSRKKWLLDLENQLIR